MHGHASLRDSWPSIPNARCERTGDGWGGCAPLSYRAATITKTVSRRCARHATAAPRPWNTALYGLNAPIFPCFEKTVMLAHTIQRGVPAGPCGICRLPGIPERTCILHFRYRRRRSVLLHKLLPEFYTRALNLAPTIQSTIDFRGISVLPPLMAEIFRGFHSAFHLLRSAWQTSYKYLRQEAAHIRHCLSGVGAPLNESGSSCPKQIPERCHHQ